MPDSVTCVVFDINVYINAIIGPDSEWPRLDQVPPSSSNAAADCLSLAFDADAFRLCASPHILVNVTRVLRGAGLSDGVTTEWLDAIIDIIEASGGMIVDPDRTVFDVADFEDNLILDLAVAVGAALVVSEDADLTQLSPWQSTLPILRPREFVARIIGARGGFVRP